MYPCRIRKFPGQTEATMSAEVELITSMTEKKPWTRPPIQMEFQVRLKSITALFSSRYNCILEPVENPSKVLYINQIALGMQV